MESGTPSLKDEFQLKNFGLTYDKPYHFSLPEWRWPSAVFVAWRVFWAVWHVGWIIRSYQEQVTNDDGAKWSIYLTNWTYSLLTLQSILHLVVVLKSRCKGKVTADDFQGQTTSTCLEKLLWYVTPIAFDLAIIVTIMYWTFLFDELTLALSVMTHAVTSFYVITDIFISASPIRLFHFVYPAMYGALYALFSLFYHLAGGTNDDGDPYVYEMLDWSSTGPTVGLVLGLIFVGVPIVHLFTFGLYTLRLYTSENCGCGRQSDKSGTTEKSNSIPPV